MSSMYENPTFRKYLVLREDYLVKQGMEEFLGGKTDNAKVLSGQLLEIRELRKRTKSAYLLVDKKRTLLQTEKVV